MTPFAKSIDDAPLRTTTSSTPSGDDSEIIPEINPEINPERIRRGFGDDSGEDSEIIPVGP
jgi:hypothetical protein